MSWSCSFGGQFQEFHNFVTISQMCQISFHVSQPRTSGSITEGCAESRKGINPSKIVYRGAQCLLLIYTGHFGTM